MSDPLHSLKPEHGKKIHCKRDDKLLNDLYARISLNYNECAVILAIVWMQIRTQKEGNDYFIPCAQCLKDAALHAKDLADALQELSEK